MKVSLSDFAQAHKKTCGLAIADKFIETAPELVSSDTFRLSPTGGEIHSGEPIVDRLKRYESLQEKIARFDRLADAVAYNRLRMMQNGQLGIDDDDDPEDYGFEQGEDLDAFGDPISVAEPKKSDASASVPPIPAEPISGDEPVGSGSQDPSGMPSNDNQVDE